jgi:hypothetical protein
MSWAEGGGIAINPDGILYATCMPSVICAKACQAVRFEHRYLKIEKICRRFGQVCTTSQKIGQEDIDRGPGLALFTICYQPPTAIAVCGRYD